MISKIGRILRGERGGGSISLSIGNDSDVFVREERERQRGEREFEGGHIQSKKEREVNLMQ